jgi:nickel-dependent lactate racemase
MERISIPYARVNQTIDIEPEYLKTTLIPAEIDEGDTRSQVEIIEEALASPIGSPPLADLCANIRRVLVVTSDQFQYSGQDRDRYRFSPAVSP